MATTTARKQYTKTKSSLGQSKTLQSLFKLFIAPFFGDIVVKDNWHLDQHELQSKLEFWFDVDNRHIFMCKALKPFKVIGQRWATKDQPLAPRISGAVERDVEEGELVWVRFNARAPDTVEVETEAGMYVVNTREFDVRIRPKLKELC